MNKRILVIFILLALVLCQALLATDTHPEGDLEKPHKKKTLRTMFEEGSLLMVSMVNYWHHYDDFIADWEFHWTLADQLRRFNPKYWCMDSNSFYTNWGHNLSGGIYYAIARANGLSAAGSFLADLCSNLVWKIFGEYREDLFGLEDMINGQFGGTAVGECMYQLSSYFSHRPGLQNRLAEFLFNPVLVLNNWLDRGQGPEFNSNLDASWNRFSLGIGYQADKVTPAGTTTVDKSGAYYGQLTASLDMELNTIPGYGEAETFQQFFSDTLSTKLFADISSSWAGVEQFRIHPSAVLFGYGWQSLEADADESVRGSSISLGFGCGFDLTKKRAVEWYDSTNGETEGGVTQANWARFTRPIPVRFTDKMSIVNLGGAVLQASWFGRQLFIHWTTEAYGDYGMINALAFNRYSASYDISGVHTTLLDWGYYYAFGMTYGSDLATEWGPWRWRAAFRYQWYRRIKGLDRYQWLGVVTNDCGIRDSRLISSSSLGYRLPHTPVELAVADEWTGRWGLIVNHDVREHYNENRIYGELRIYF